MIWVGGGKCVTTGGKFVDLVLSVGAGKDTQREVGAEKVEEGGRG